MTVLAITSSTFPLPCSIEAGFPQYSILSPLLFFSPHFIDLHSFIGKCNQIIDNIAIWTFNRQRKQIVPPLNFKVINFCSDVDAPDLILIPKNPLTSSLVTPTKIFIGISRARKLNPLFDFRGYFFYDSRWIHDKN